MSNIFVTVLMLVNTNKAVQCLFMLVHIALTNDFNKVVLHVEIDINKRLTNAA